MENESKGKSKEKQNRTGKKSGRRYKKSGKDRQSKKEKHNWPNRNEEEITEYIRDMTDNTCSKICLDMIRGLGLIFSDRCNAQWDIRDFYRYLVAMCADAGENGTAERQHIKSMNLMGMAQLPTRTWLFDKIKPIRYDYMLSRCMKMISRTVKRARRYGLLRGSVDVSIDMHDIPLYARVMSLIFGYASEYKKGTSFFTRLATIHCVTNGHRITLGVILVKRGDRMEDVVYDLLRMCEKNGIRVNSVTLNSGFYSTRVVSTMKRHGVPFLSKWSGPP